MPERKLGPVSPPGRLLALLRGRSTGLKPLPDPPSDLNACFRLTDRFALILGRSVTIRLTPELEEAQRRDQREASARNSDNI